MADLLRDLVSYSRGMSELRTRDGEPRGWYQLLASRGAAYEGSPQDHGFKKGTPKECFSNALHLALDNHMLYAEGFATHPKLGGIPIEHAWCVSADGEVVDNTWSYPDAVYYGLVFSPVKAGRIVQKLGYYGISGSLFNDRDGSVMKFINQDYGD